MEETPKYRRVRWRTVHYTNQCMVIYVTSHGKTCNVTITLVALIFYKGIDGNMGQHVYNLCQSYIQIVNIYRK